jgi:PIN domain nuclease of toxin-antitoxin system
VNLLLDTHIWLWSLLEPERLAPEVISALTEGDARLWLSPLSVWEASLLIERSRVLVDVPPERWLRDALERAPMEEAYLTREVCFVSRTLKTRQRDPVDRFLAATAQVFDLTLVTADADLLKVKEIRTLPNKATRRGQRRARHRADE